MKIFEPLFIDVIEKLIQCEVKFLLIGGYAVNYYGYGRYTGDIDFWIETSEENKNRFINFLVALNRDNDAIEKIKQINFKNAQVISLGEQPLRVDFLTKVNLVEFDDAWNKKRYFQLKNQNVPVVDYEHLILTKISTGRTKDKLDIEELQKINKK